MKRIIKSILFVTILGLASCKPANSTSAGSTNSGGNNYVSIPPGAKYYQETNTKYTLRDANEQIGWNTLNSTGNQKMLIVPVQLSGCTAWTNTMLDNLNKVFFGEASDTDWHSVSSYFETSSYGKLKITGEVTSVFRSSYTEKQVRNFGEACSDYIASEFQSSSQYSNDLKKAYDQDNDGYIDCTIFIYTNRYENSATTPFWAWCYYTDSYPNRNAPTVNNYMWASYYFMEDGYSSSSAPSGLDAHTFIHESGHLLGLDDYYCYDSSKPWDAAGDREMQSYNIGDHNIYSKLAMGWIDPLVPVGNCQIKLRSSALYGDAILLKNNWNHSVFDEYILIEYYTPEGLNELDSRFSYDSRNRMYTQSGLRIYHVDARLVKLKEVNTVWGVTYVANGYTSDFIDNTPCFVGASNSLEMAYIDDTQIRYVHLIDSGNRNTLAAGSSGGNSIKINGNETLWLEGSSFSATSAYFKNGNDKFNDGTNVGYSITVGAISNGSITVNINTL